jgi:hypothetical protein
MPKTLTEVTRDAADLPEIERLKLVRILLDLSESEIEPTPDVQEDWDREIWSSPDRSIITTSARPGWDNVSIMK